MKINVFNSTFNKINEDIIKQNFINYKFELHKYLQQYDDYYNLIIETEEYLYCITDVLRYKLLYYYWDNNKFICSDKISLILDKLDYRPEIDLSALNEYLSHGTNQYKTLYKNIFKLDVGEYLLYNKNKNILTKCYQYDLKNLFLNKKIYNDEKFINDKLKEIINNSLDKNIQEEDVILYSGGIDSSILVDFYQKKFNKKANTITFTNNINDLKTNQLFMLSHSILKSNNEIIEISLFDLFKNLLEYTLNSELPIGFRYNIYLTFLNKNLTVITGDSVDALFKNLIEYKFSLINNIKNYNYNFLSCNKINIIKNYDNKIKLENQTITLNNRIYYMLIYNFFNFCVESILNILKCKFPFMSVDLLIFLSNTFSDKILINKKQIIDIFLNNKLHNISKFAKQNFNTNILQQYENYFNVDEFIIHINNMHNLFNLNLLKNYMNPKLKYYIFLFSIWYLKFYKNYNNNEIKKLINLNGEINE